MPSLIQFLEEIDYDNAKVTSAVLYLADGTVTANLALKFDHGKRALRPYVLTSALSGQGNRHLLGYQQQDAQEFFQHVSSLISVEGQKRTRMSLDIFAPVDAGLKYYYAGKECSMNRLSHGKSPLTGLLASRITCMQCGYKSPMKHDTFDNLSLTIPAQSGVSLKRLLRNYTSPEIIQGFICDKCSMLATKKSLQKLQSKQPNESQKTPSAKSDTMKAKKKKKKKNSAKAISNIPAIPLTMDRESQLKFITSAISLENFEIEFPKEIEKTKIYAAVTKQISIENTPKCLCLHMQRSMYLPSGHLIKNNAAVVFEDTLDITDMIVPQIPLKESLKSLPVKTTASSSSDTFPGVEIVKEVADNIIKPKLQFKYELVAVILHYGHHEAGHFITLRKIKHTTEKGTKDIWFRISDATIDRITDVENDVFSHGSQYAYMIFYERIK
ncbi:hypothetical protein HDV01_005218 [Terramyces sp. JEL0728]|nr:hypothetical protein HDV01_005218 [Terramyces sp. JEL0728]